MTSFWTRSGVLLCGIATSLLVAIGVTAIEALTGFGVYTFNIWLFVPAGAFVCGLLAASGYFVAAKFLQLAPGKGLLFQMIAVAALTQLIIYFFEYSLVIGFDYAHSPSFLAYLQISLTKAHYVFSRGSMQGDPGEVGEAGYVLALIQFAAFAVAGAAVYLKLEDVPSCSTCDKYLTVVGKRMDSFDDEQAFADYFDNEFTQPVDSAEFADHVGPRKTASRRAGAIRLKTELLACPQCGEQTLTETILMPGQNAPDGPHRMVPIPVGVDVRAAYFGPDR